VKTDLTEACAKLAYDGKLTQTRDTVGAGD